MTVFWVPKGFLPTTDERRVQVYDIVLHGSSPRAAFFVIVALSTVIPAFEEVLTTFGERARQCYEGAQAGEKPVVGN